MQWELHGGVRMPRGVHEQHGASVPTRDVLAGRGWSVHRVPSRAIWQQLGRDVGELHWALCCGSIRQRLGPDVGELHWELHRGLCLRPGVNHPIGSPLSIRNLQSGRS